MREDLPTDPKVVANLDIQDLDANLADIAIACPKILRESNYAMLKIAWQRGYLAGYVEAKREAREEEPL